MASIAIGAQGTLLKLESSTSVGLYTTIPEVHKIQAPNIKYDLLETSSHDSVTFKEYIPGLADGENIVASYWFVPSNAIHIQIRTDAYARTKKNFQIIFPGGGTGAQMAPAAYIVGMQPQADSNTVLMSQLTAKCTGTITWT